MAVEAGSEPGSFPPTNAWRRTSTDAPAGRGRPTGPIPTPSSRSAQIRPRLAAAACALPHSPATSSRRRGPRLTIDQVSWGTASNGTITDLRQTGGDLRGGPSTALPDIVVPPRNACTGRRSTRVSSTSSFEAGAMVSTPTCRCRLRGGTESSPAASARSQPEPQLPRPDGIPSRRSASPTPGCAAAAASQARSSHGPSSSKACRHEAGGTRVVIATGQPSTRRALPGPVPQRDDVETMKLYLFEASTLPP